MAFIFTISDQRINESITLGIGDYCLIILALILMASEPLRAYKTVRKRCKRHPPRDHALTHSHALAQAHAHANAHTTTSQDLGGGLPRQVKGGGKPPPWGSVNR